MKRGDDGNWSLDLANNVVEGITTRARKNIEKDKLFVKPYNIARTMWGGQTSLDEAINDGQAKEVLKNDVRHIAWQEFKATKERSTSSSCVARETSKVS